MPKLSFPAECTFVAGAMTAEAIPSPRLAEVAFAGRSNVGKSSLVNALTGRKALARTSKTPGRTKQLNFFALGDALMLVDLPGYGYADAPKQEVAAWTKLTKRYLCGRPNLRRVFLLLDARHPPKKADTDFMGMLDEAAVSYQIVLTKMDKLKAKEQEAALEAAQVLAGKHAAALGEILPTSSHSDIGIQNLRDLLVIISNQ